MQLCAHMGVDPNTIRTVLPAEEAAVYLEEGRGQRRRRKNELKSVALEIVTVSDAKPHYIWGLLCNVGCPHNTGLVSSGDVAHMFVLWDMHVHPPPIACPFIHSPCVPEVLDPCLSPGDTLARIMVEGWGYTGSQHPVVSGKHCIFKYIP